MTDRKLALAILLPFLALALQWLLWPLLAPFVWFLFYPTVFLSARLGGLKGGVISTVLSTCLVWYFFMPPQLSWALDSPSKLYSIILFLIMGYFFSDTYERLQHAQDKNKKADIVRQSENRFTATFEQASVGIAMLTPDGHWLRANQKLCNIVGYSHAELLSKTFQDLTYPEDLNADLAYVRQMLAGEIHTYAMEKRYLHKGGSIIWVNLTVSLVRLADGSPDYFISVVEDIHQRKLTETALLQSQAKLAEAQHIAHIGSWVYDFNGHITWSEETYRIWGVCPENFTPNAETFESLIYPEDRPAMQAWIAACLAEQQPSDLVFRRLLPCGDLRYLLGRGELKHDDQRNTLYMAGTIQDVTQLKKNEEALRVSQERLQLALEASQDGLWDWDLTSGVVFRSPRYYALVECQPEEDAADFEFFKSTVQVDDLPHALASIEAHKQGKTTAIEFDYRLASQSGKLCWLLVKGRVVKRDANGAPLRIVGTLSDITERKQGAEEIRRLNADLQQRLSERAAAEAILRKTQQANLDAQRQASLAALNLMEDAFAARASAETANVTLRKSEQHYRLLFKANPHPMWVFDMETLVFLAVNDAAINHYGYSREEFLAMTIKDIRPSEDIPKLLDALGLSGSGIQNPGCWRHRRKDGSVILVEITTHAVDFDDRRAQIVLAYDVTERKRMEQELHDSEARFRIATENLRDAFILIDGETTKIVLWNAAAVSMFGYSKDEAIGQPMHQLLAPPSYHQATTQGIAHFARTGKGDLVGRTLELPALRHNGEQFSIELSLSAMQIGGKWHGAGVIRDITLRKESEAELQRYRDHLEDMVEKRTEELSRQSLSLQAMIDNIPHMAWLKDKEGRFIAANRAVANALRQTPRELLGKGYLDLWPQAIAEQYRADNEVVMATRRPITLVQPLANQPNSLYEIFIAPIIDEEGSVIGTAGFSRDIKPQRDMEAELAHRASVAEAATQAKTAFLTNMSHEIRTPMNAIIGLTYLLRQTALNPEQNERLEKIDTATQHLLSLINDILDLAKIDAGRLQLELVDFALPSLMDTIYSLVIEQAKAKGLTLTMDSGDLPLGLRGDLTRLRQALLNYVGNAIKFTEQGGITIRTRVLKESARSVLARFEVQDTGIGIEEQVLPTLFENFNQADISITRKYGGSGLGLAITRRLASLMGGKAGVESCLGQGSTFWFTARLERSHAKPSDSLTKTAFSEAEKRLLHQYAGIRLLLAEDSPINREVAMDLLSRVGLAVEIAETGKVALEKVATGTYPLILMDVQMPEMDGITATQAIRKQPGYTDVPIIAMTANVFDEQRQACIAAGMNDFIAKPVSSDALYATLLRWLSLHNAKDVDSAVPENLPTPLIPSRNTVVRSSGLAIAGLDSESGLATVKGNLALYHKLLRQFAVSHRADMQLILQQLRAGNTQQAQYLAHTLKGVAATLGANPVAALATTLDLALQQNSALEHTMEIARQGDVALAQLADAIITAIGAVTTKVSAVRKNPLADTKHSQQIVCELERLLSESNSRANALTQASADLLLDKMGDKYFDFYRQIDVFDYESALKILREFS